VKGHEEAKINGCREISDVQSIKSELKMARA
jgi:hypothetical protein